MQYTCDRCGQETNKPVMVNGEPMCPKCGGDMSESAPAKSMKAGARHSAADMKLLKEIKQAAQLIFAHADQLGALEEQAPADEATETPQDEEAETPDEQQAEDDAGTEQPIADDTQPAPPKKKPIPPQFQKNVSILQSLGDDVLINFGGALKSMGKGWVGGYLVRFGSPQERDIESDYFTAQTYFGKSAGNGADVFLNHAQPIMRGLPKSLEKFNDYNFKNPLKTKVDDVGVFAQHLLDVRDEYENAIYELCKSGKLGWSSGALSHLVKRNKSGAITRWVIGEGSYTPTPAEYRESNLIMPLKSWINFDAVKKSGEAVKAIATATHDIPADLFAEAQLIKARFGG